MKYNKIIIHPVSFPSIPHMIAMISAEKIIFEMHDFFEKQTYRNRYYIHTAHGKQMLSVPVKHSKSNTHRPTNSVIIANDFDWQRRHWKSLETAYRTSPYFEFYEDELRPLFKTRYEKLTDFNLATIKKIFDLLEIPLQYGFTDTYRENYNEGDFRFLVDAKRPFDFLKTLSPYTQVFSDRQAFMPGLSVLDLLFMEGPAAKLYLEKHKGLPDGLLPRPS
jgi:hypothetical protein